jgi:hypothetical protein
MLDFVLHSGQMVRIKIDSTTRFLGIINGNGRTKEADGSVILYKYKLLGIKALLGFLNAEVTFSKFDLVFNAAGSTSLILDECGFERGEISTWGYFHEKYYSEGKAIKDVYDDLAALSGATWFVTCDGKINFEDQVTVYDNCSVTLDKDWGTFEDYRNFTVDEDYSNYFNCVHLIGGEYEGVKQKIRLVHTTSYFELLNIAGYQAKVVEVINDSSINYDPDTNILDIPTGEYFVFDTTGDLPDVSVGDMVYNRTRKARSIVKDISVYGGGEIDFEIDPPISGQTWDDEMWYMPELNDVVNNILATKGTYPALSITFESFSDYFYPRMKLRVNQPDMNCHGYFCISSVNIKDLGAGIFQYNVNAEKKLGSPWNVEPNNDYSKLFKIK